jgi:hypothetical protein
LKVLEIMIVFLCCIMGMAETAWCQIFEREIK